MCLHQRERRRCKERRMSRCRTGWRSSGKVLMVLVEMDNHAHFATGAAAHPLWSWLTANKKQLLEACESCVKSGSEIQECHRRRFPARDSLGASEKEKVEEGERARAHAREQASERKREILDACNRVHRHHPYSFLPSLKPGSPTFLSIRQHFQVFC